MKNWNQNIHLEEQELSENEAVLKLVLEAWEREGIGEVNILAAHGNLKSLEDLENGESCYYGEYDAAGKRSGI